MMTSSRKQTLFMAAIFVTFAAVYCLDFKNYLPAVTVLFGILFPVQILLWRLTFGKKIKDFFFGFSLLALLMILKHFWEYSDLLFYVISIILAAVFHYRTFFTVTICALALETLREFLRSQESPDEILFRYALFFVAGTLTYFLLREEKKQKEEFKRELDDLKYGIHQVDKAPVAMLNDSVQTSRKVDAAIALDEALRKILDLIHGIFKADSSLIWQYIPQKQQLRIRNHSGGPELKVDYTFEMGEGPIGWTAVNRKTFLKQGPDPISIPFYKKNRAAGSLIAVPIVDNERLEGVISLDSSHQNFFSADVETALKSFAAQILETIRMARVAKEREERAFEFQAFYHASKELASIIDFEEIIKKLHLLAGEIVSTDFTAIAVVKPETNEYSLYEWRDQQENPLVTTELPNDATTWISWFLQSIEEPLILSESQLEIQQIALLRKDEDAGKLHTYLAVPMRHQQISIGALLLGSYQKDAFTSHQSRILSILCNQAAVSLENSGIITKMEQLAITDGLTGLFNRRYFQDAFDRELERAARLKQPLTLLLMDIDHFKGFNDSFGHPVGDFILKSLAELLLKNARKIDILARYGGEEFAALLPGIDGKNARKTAERWRKAVQRASFKRENKSFAVTISAGFAAFPDDASLKVDLTERADRALYDAKENGRNQVRHCGDLDSSRNRLFG